MNTILKTKHVEYENSAYLIDLVQHSGGQKYVAITQKNLLTGKDQIIKIRPGAIVQIANALFNSHPDHVENDLSEKKFPNTLEDQKIIGSYLKGLTIKEISVIYGKSEKVIEQTLRNNDIEITEQKFISKFWKRRTRK